MKKEEERGGKTETCGHFYTAEAGDGGLIQSHSIGFNRIGRSIQLTSAIQSLPWHFAHRPVLALALALPLVPISLSHSRYSSRRKPRIKGKKQETVWRAVIAGHLVRLLLSVAYPHSLLFLLSFLPVPLHVHF